MQIMRVLFFAQDFKPADGQQRRQVYKNLKAVAIAMGLPPSRHLATMLTEPAREALKKEFKGGDSLPLLPNRHLLAESSHADHV